MKLGGYTVQEVIYAFAETVVARAKSDAGEQVVLKYQSNSQPSPDLNARWQHEYAVLQSIQSKWVIRPLGLKQVDYALVLVLEDFGSCNLAHLAAQNTNPNIDLADRIALALQLCEALSAVHEHRLIHGDVSSKNVLVDVVGLRLKLCDFGLSTRLDHEQKPGHDGILRGTLEYMSPEQTGRTNLDVDYRSDFYSLGVTLYELFCGRTPFQSNDPMTLLHAQIAITPTPLHILDPAFPETLSKIVQKLLSKSPDDRYQSSFGLQSDLTECAQQWHRCRRIEPMPLARADIPERFCIANKLYGREAETAAIVSAFERISTGRAELQLISGYSGIGKTALVSELHRPIIARRGYFVRGKCDQYSRNQPYSALIQAFQQLLRQLAAEGEQRRSYWRTELSAALGENAAAVNDIIPGLALLIGVPAALPVLPAAENENRFHIAFSQFVKALSSRVHPLVVFLDDLQWADASTLKLIEHLVRVDAELCTLIIGAYRDNEVDDVHPLRLAINAMERAQLPVAHLRLRDLSLAEVSELIADTLHSTPAEVATLAALCLEKTQGNPFFLSQFLRALEQNGEVHYVRSEGSWRWNITQIRLRGMTDNVVELMLEKLRTLHEDTQNLLTLAAHLGDSFDMRQLMAVGGADALKTADVLWPALRSGMVLPVNEGYKFLQNPEKLKTARYRFLHDRVQQAAYSLTLDSERKALQLRSGRLLLASSTESELEARLFTILELFNQALELVQEPSERARLLELNVRGGLWAKSASAFTAASRLLRCAKSLLLENAWQSQPEQTLALYKGLAEAEYLSGNFAAAERLYPEGIAATDSAIAKATLCLVQVDQYHIQARFIESYEVLLLALKLLGRSFPADEAQAAQQFPADFALTEQLLEPFSDEHLLAAAEITEPEFLIELRIYAALSFATYQSGRFNAFVVDGCRMVQAILRHGQSDLSCIGYAAFVTSMSAMGRPYSQCYRMGKLALTLAEQRENKHYRINIYQYFPAFYQHWGEPLANTFAYMEKGFEIGQTGINPLSTGYCALLRSVNKFVQGVALDELELECERGLKFLQISHQPNTENMLHYGVLLPVQALRAKSVHPLSFDTAQCSATEFFNGDYQSPSIVLAFYSAAMIRHAYFLDDRAQWQQFSANLGIIRACLPDSPTWTEASFYVALGLFREEFADPDQREANYRAAQLHLECFNVWAEGSEENFRHKYLLLAAEAARIRGDDKAAMDLYARAIDSAKDADYPACEALANELYARFWLAQNQRQLASNFIREAHFHYRRWGALAKCQHIEQHWPNITFRVLEQRQTMSNKTATFRNVSEQTGLLDLQSLLKANQLIAKEIQLDSLLQKMLEVLLENAGAELGAIILDDDDQLIVEAAGGVTEGRRVHCERIRKRLADYVDNGQPLLPHTIIEYVRLTRAALVLNSPAADERFSNSVYLRQRQPKSVICMPVVTQGKLVALVYLENNQLDNAFTAKQQMTLELLSGQAAISLVNARLYESLEQKVMQRTEELRQMSLKDGLTGIANRRSFDERLSFEWRRSLRSGEPISLLMVDIDHFKQYNDHYGHLEGDYCITAVAQSLQGVVSRASDLVARYGGEEFAILLPETGADEANRIAEITLRNLAARAIPHANSPVSEHVSLSIGICTLTVTPESQAASLISQADQALYYAKRRGRAQLCHFAGLA